jgi:hypothetical protein
MAGAFPTPTEPEVITVVAHPAERRRRRATMQAQAGNCCCTCCCCLHVVGGLLGAVVGPFVGGRSTPAGAQQALRNWEALEEQKAPSLHDPDAIKTESAISSETPARALDAPGEKRDFTLPPQGIRGVLLFWVTLLVLVVLGGPVVALWKDVREISVAYLLILLFFLPGFQIGACLVTYVILIVSSRPDSRYQILQVSKILVGVVVGAGAGLLLLFFVCKPL